MKTAVKKATKKIGLVALAGFIVWAISACDMDEPRIETPSYESPASVSITNIYAETR